MRGSRVRFPPSAPVLVVFILMSQPSQTENELPRRSRSRQREMVSKTLAYVVGCLALLAMIAALFMVATGKLWESTRFNEQYVDSVYEDAKGRKWSGNFTESRALIDSADDVRPKNASARFSDGLKETGQALKPSKAPKKTLLETFPNFASSAASTVNGIQNIEGKRLEIEAVIRGFFEANTVDMKLVFARDSLRVKPLMQNYYRSHPLNSLRWKNLGWLMSVDEKGHRLGYAQAIFDDAEPINVIVEETAEGRYRVDWESSVSYGELDWKDFLKVRPVEPTLLRVVASKPASTPHGRAAQGTEVIEIKHPAQEGSVLAFFDRNDPKFQPLIEQLQSGNWKDVPLTLRLCFPGTSSTGGTLMGAKIANIEGKGWLILQGTRS